MTVKRADPDDLYSKFVQIPENTFMCVYVCLSVPVCVPVCLCDMYVCVMTSVLTRIAYDAHCINGSVLNSQPKISGKR